MRKLIVIFAVMALFAFPTHSQSACPDLTGDGKTDLNDVIQGLRILTDISVSSIPAPIPDIDNNSKIGLPEIIYMLQIISELRQCSAYPVVGTNQTVFYNNAGEITAPAIGQPYYGQAAFHWLSVRKAKVLCE